MILTEEEAKTKRCQEGFGPMPQATVYAAAPSGMGGGNMQYSLPTMGTAPVTCIGSACMAWRFIPKRDLASGNPSVGFCGKAGKP